MATKFEIERRIIDNARQRKLRAEIDELDYLVPVKISDEYLDLNSFSTLRNSWKKKSIHFIPAVLLIILIYQIVIRFEFSESWFGIGLLSLSVVPFFRKLFENKPILKISPEGLTIYPDVFNKWSEIEYLYFHTKYDNEGSESGVFLVLNSKTLSDYEVLVSDLQWPLEKLGVTLYQCMRRYGGNSA